MTTPTRPRLIPTLGVETRAWIWGEGNGRPLILVHGFRGDHHGLTLIAEELHRLEPSRPVVVPDLPGFGETPPLPGREHDLRTYGEWLRAFSATIPAYLDTAGERSRGRAHGVAFDVLGHSFGSLVVAEAVSHGLSPHAVVLINPISSPALEGPNAFMTQLAIGYYRLADSLPPSQARALLGNPLIVRVMSEVMARTRDPQLRRWIHGQHAAHFSSFANTTALLEAFRASVSTTVTSMSRAFDMPTLIIAGDRDDIAPLIGQVTLRNRITGSELRVIPGVGHLVHYEAPIDAAAYTMRFLQRVEQRAPDESDA